MTLSYTPEILPTQLLRDLLLTYWDARTGGEIPRPIIIEKPPPEYQRADIRNSGNLITVEVEGFRERHITIAFQHREWNVDMLLRFEVFTSRQRLFDLIQEARRVIFSKQHEPTDYLLDGFETYTSSANLNLTWTTTLPAFSTITLLTTARQFGVNSMRVVAAGGDGEVYRALPSTTLLVPRPFPGRLRQVRFYARVDSGAPVIGVTLRQSTNRTGLFRTWNVTVDTTAFSSYSVDFSIAASSSAGTWDSSLIDEIAFTSIDSGRTLDIDHIDLSTREFQFLQYGGYIEHTDYFNYWGGEIRCQYRSTGEVVPVLT